MKRAGNAALATADDAAVIKGSWHEPELFAELFDRHAPHIHRYLTRRTDPHLPDHAERVVVTVTAQAIRSSLAEALAALSDGDRDVLLLIAWEDLTYDEAALALGIPVGIVRSRLHMIIFDARTYAYLGLTTWGEQGQVGGDALLQIAIVNQAGQLP
jgi:Sigma-70, region 4